MMPTRGDARRFGRLLAVAAVVAWVVAPFAAGSLDAAYHQRGVLFYNVYPGPQPACFLVGGFEAPVGPLAYGESQWLAIPKTDATSEPLWQRAGFADAAGSCEYLRESDWASNRGELQYVDDAIVLEDGTSTFVSVSVAPKVDPSKPHDEGWSGPSDDAAFEAKLTVYDPVPTTLKSFFIEVRDYESCRFSTDGFFFEDFVVLDDNFDIDIACDEWSYLHSGTIAVTCDDGDALPKVNATNLIGSHICAGASQRFVAIGALGNDDYPLSLKLFQAAPEDTCTSCADALLEYSSNDGGSSSSSSVLKRDNLVILLLAISVAVLAVLLAATVAYTYKRWLRKRRRFDFQDVEVVVATKPGEDDDDDDEDHMA
mmetsp:Transcript_27199/g.108908  ORF Transcript_27199/g.108908 Transcript_27199/m.108908 type:complete len:370 (+) Transcript_27199:54-1163(+)